MQIKIKMLSDDVMRRKDTTLNNKDDCATAHPSRFLPPI